MLLLLLLYGGDDDDDNGDDDDVAADGDDAIAAAAQSLSPTTSTPPHHFKRASTSIALLLALHNTFIPLLGNMADNSQHAAEAAERAAEQEGVVQNVAQPVDAAQQEGDEQNAVLRDASVRAPPNTLLFICIVLMAPIGACCFGRLAGCGG